VSSRPWIELKSSRWEIDWNTCQPAMRLLGKNIHSCCPENGTELWKSCRSLASLCLEMHQSSPVGEKNNHETVMVEVLLLFETSTSWCSTCRLRGVLVQQQSSPNVYQNNYSWDILIEILWKCIYFSNTKTWVRSAVVWIGNCFFHSKIWKYVNKVE
jgi:hypothetical protein